MADIPRGLSYYPDVLDEQFVLLMRRWLLLESTQEKLFSVSKSTSARRVIHLGYTYDYRSGGTKKKSEYPIEHILQLLIESGLARAGLDIAPERMNQCIINRYNPGQGIGAHIDRVEYGDVVVCFTFFAGREMEFTRGKETFTLYTEPGSMYVMSGESRYEWKHAMRGRQTDTVRGKKVPRRTSYSITFREVPL